MESGDGSKGSLRDEDYASVKRLRQSCNWKFINHQNVARLVCKTGSIVSTVLLNLISATRLLLSSRHFTTAPLVYRMKSLSDAAVRIQYAPLPLQELHYVLFHTALENLEALSEERSRLRIAPTGRAPAGPSTTESLDEKTSGRFRRTFTVGGLVGAGASHPPIPDKASSKSRTPAADRVPAGDNASGKRAPDGTEAVSQKSSTPTEITYAYITPLITYCFVTYLVPVLRISSSKALFGSWSAGTIVVV